MSPTKRVFLVLILLTLITTVLRLAGGVPRTSGPMAHDVYVWQRDWTDAVKSAVRDRDPSLNLPVFLAIETDGAGQTARVPIDLSTVAGRPFGLALRVSATDPTRVDRALLQQLIAELAAHKPAELHLDLDCAEGRLDAYVALLEYLKPAAAGVPIVITALPAWLDQTAFSRLARLGPYVLQVHSLQRPEKMGDDWKLIDPVAARRDVERAARLGRPFRVALPTYGVVAVFDQAGKFLRIYSENAPPLDAAATQLRFLRADPIEMSQLVQHWTTRRPSAVQGVIWYRLPVEPDQLNWRPITLSAVMKGQPPTPKIALQTPVKTGLIDLHLTNAGSAEAPLPPTIKLTWDGPAPLATDAVGGYSKLDASPTHLTLTLTAGVDRADSRTLSPDRLLRPGDRRAIGWLKFTQDTEVRSEIIFSP